MTDTTATEKPLKPPAPPSDLKRNGPGRRLWRSVVGTDTVRYILRPDELRILAAACTCDDAIAELRKKKDELEKHPEYKEMTVRGSQGQRVENPLRASARKCIDEIRAQDSALAGHLAKLKLPDEDGGATAEQPRSVGARAAAQSRWGTNG